MPAILLAALLCSAPPVATATAPAAPEFLPAVRQTHKLMAGGAKLEGSAVGEVLFIELRLRGRIEKVDTEAGELLVRMKIRVEDRELTKYYTENERKTLAALTEWEKRRKAEIGREQARNAQKRAEVLKDLQGEVERVRTEFREAATQRKDCYELVNVAVALPADAVEREWLRRKTFDGIVRPQTAAERQLPEWRDVLWPSRSWPKGDRVDLKLGPVLDRVECTLVRDLAQERS
jgi:hypothetical protein